MPTERKEVHHHQQRPHPQHILHDIQPVLLCCRRPLVAPPPPRITRSHVQIDPGIGLRLSATASGECVRPNWQFTPTSNSRTHTVHPSTPATHPSRNRVLRHFFTSHPPQRHLLSRTLSPVVPKSSNPCPQAFTHRASLVSPSAPYF